MTTLQGLVERVSAGGTLADAEASTLLGTHDLIALGVMADEVRRRLHGTETTFVRVFEMHVDAVPAALPAGIDAGEYRLVGSAASLDRACAAVSAAKRLSGGTPLTGFSLADVNWPGAAAADVFARLRAAGLDGLADTPIDADAAVVDSARSAGLQLLRLTVHAAPPDPFSIVVRARQLQRTAGGFRAIAPLPRAVDRAAPTTGYDDVKLLALARVFLTEIPSIQVDWPLYGPKLAQVGLTVGADDVDGVAAVETGALGARRSAIEEITRNIRAAALTPLERDGLFGLRRAAAAPAGGPDA